MNIIMLAFAPIRKNKGQTATLLILLTVAGMLLYLGLMLAMNTDKFFDRKAEELDAADIVVILQNTIYSEDDAAYFRDNPKIQSVEIAESFAFPYAIAEYAGSSISTSFVFIDENELGGMLSPRIIGDRLTAVDSTYVYLPYQFHIGGGFNLGDTIDIEYGAEVYTFNIAGFFEDIHFGYYSSGFTAIILPDYHGFLNDLESPVYCSILMARVYEKKDADIYSDYRFDKIFETNPQLLDTSFMIGTNYTFSKMIMTGVNIVSTIIILFSLLIVAVALIVAHFRVTNFIEDDMANIGSLKAAGYVSGQIISGILIQFLLIALTGGLLGIFASAAVSPMLSTSFASQNGLSWDIRFDTLSVLLTLVILSASVFLTVLWAARKIKQLSPIIALRGGLTTHNFKKNYFPLDKSKGGLSFLLALKSMKLKQNVSIALICAAVTFASAVFVIMYYNVGVDDSAFVGLVITEYSEAVVTVSTDALVDPWQVLQDIRNMKGVKNAAFYSSLMAYTERRYVALNITDNFDDLTGTYIYEGRFPKHDNEIAIGGTIADALGKGIGDAIIFNFQGGTAEYLICGLGQSTFNNGWGAALTLEGARLMNPSYRPPVINVYAEKDISPVDLCEMLRSHLGTDAESIQNIEDEMVAMQTYIDMVFIITVSILSVTVLVIALVLYLIIKTSILRRRRMLGIQKAVGFTTGQLMRQIVIDFMPAVLMGVALGSVLGGFYVNPVVGLLFRGIGFMKTEFIVQPLLISVAGAAIGLFALSVATAVSWRIRKISAYALVSE